MIVNRANGSQGFVIDKHPHMEGEATIEYVGSSYGAYKISDLRKAINAVDGSIVVNENVVDVHDVLGAMAMVVETLKNVSAISNLQDYKNGLSRAIKLIEETLDEFVPFDFPTLPGVKFTAKTILGGNEAEFTTLSGGGNVVYMTTNEHGTKLYFEESGVRNMYKSFKEAK